MIEGISIVVHFKNRLAALQPLMAEVFVVDKVCLFHQIAHVTPKNRNGRDHLLA